MRLPSTLPFATLIALITLVGCADTEADPQSDPPEATTATEVPSTPAPGQENVAEWLAGPGADHVDSSLLVTILDPDTALCVDYGPACLAEVCPDPLGCLVLADIHTTSTPDSLFGGPPLRIQALFSQVVHYDEAPGPAPVLYGNHGGGEMSDPDLELLLLGAYEGYALLASHYRGSGGSEGIVEGCLGEIDDVLSLVDLGHLAAPDARHVMVGGSHGGCVTLGALHRGADVEKAVALFPAVDGGRRYPWHKRQLMPGSDLQVAAQTCPLAQADVNFLSDMITDAEFIAGGELPNWQTADYRCDDPTFAPASDAWAAIPWIGEQICIRAPLQTASHLNDAFEGDLLLIHGERDVVIPYAESCHYVEQAGGFTAYRIDDQGQWATGGCAQLPATADRPDPEWAGDRHFVLVEPLGHGDARASISNPCDPSPFEIPDVNGLWLDFLEDRP